jgi:hypothetical protein
MKKDIHQTKPLSGIDYRVRTYLSLAKRRDVKRVPQGDIDALLQLYQVHPGIRLGLNLWWAAWEQDREYEVFLNRLLNKLRKHFAHDFTSI